MGFRAAHGRCGRPRAGVRTDHGGVRDERHEFDVIAPFSADGAVVIVLPVFHPPFTQIDDAVVEVVGFRRPGWCTACLLTIVGEPPARRVFVEIIAHPAIIGIHLFQVAENLL